MAFEFDVLYSRDIGSDAGFFPPFHLGIATRLNEACTQCRPPERLHSSSETRLTRSVNQKQTHTHMEKGGIGDPINGNLLTSTRRNKRSTVCAAGLAVLLTCCSLDAPANSSLADSQSVGKTIRKRSTMDIYWERTN